MGWDLRQQGWAFAVVASALGLGAPSASAWQDGEKPAQDPAEKPAEEEVDRETMRKAEGLFKDAFKHYQKAEDNDALKKIDEALETWSQVPHGHYLKAEVLLMQKRLGLAEQSFRAAIEAEPEFAPAHDSLGVVFLVKREYGNAQKSFEQAIECDKRFSDAHLHLGMMWERQNKRKDAEIEYRTAIKLNAKNVLAHRRLGFFYLNNKPPDPKAAEKSFLIVTKLDPRDFHALYIYGYCLDIQDKHSAAQRIYEKVTTYDPKHADAWRNLGITHERGGSKKGMEEALKCYEKYVELKGKDVALVKSWIQAIKQKLEGN